MRHSRTLSRMLTAAEEWGHTTYGQKMSALLNPARRHGDNGALFMTVKLYQSWPASRSTPTLEPVECAVTLEPDGSVRCTAANDRSRAP